MTLIKDFKMIEKYRKNEISLPEGRYVVFSDLHLGVGDIKDESLQNNLFLFNALKYYLEYNYCLILNGDIFELAMNKDVREIAFIHDDIMWLFEQFYEKGRLIYIKGNHDMNIKQKDFQQRFDKYTRKNKEFMPNIKICDSVLINNRYLIQHGHQAYWRYSSWFNKVVLFLGVNVFKKLRETIWEAKTTSKVGYNDWHSVEKLFSKYGVENNLLTVTGHTHELQWDAPNNFNVGSGVNPRFISCGEITPGHENPSLVKWCYKIDSNNNNRVIFIRELI